MKYFNTLLVVCVWSVVLCLLSIAVDAQRVEFIQDSIDKEYWGGRVAELQSKYPELVQHSPLIRVSERIPNRCGYCFFSGVIIMSIEKDCIDRGFEEVFIHEHRHAMFFNAPFQQRIDYCEDKGYSYQDSECWEVFAWGW